MDVNFALIASNSEFSRGIASDLLISQLIDLRMEDEKRANHNRFEMERNSYRAAGPMSGERRVRSIFGKPAHGSSRKIHPVQRVIGIKD